MNILGINAVFHDSSAALSVGGRIVAASEEERFNRRKHAKNCMPFTAWELPVQAAAWCLQYAGLKPQDVDVIAYSYDPSLATSVSDDVMENDWEALRTLYAKRAPHFLRAALPGIERAAFEFVPHHIAHAASAYLAAPLGDCAVIVADGRGERGSYVAGKVRDGRLNILASQELPHSLGLLYEELTVHLGFHRSSDEYKVMGLAGYGKPKFLDALRSAVRVLPGGGFAVDPLDFCEFAPARAADGPFSGAHADLAASVQTRLEEVLLELAQWLAQRTGDRVLTMAGGVALNCVANARLAREGPFERIWVQPAAGDAGTALGAAMFAAHKHGERVVPMTTAALGREWDDAELGRRLNVANVQHETPDDIALEVARILAQDGVVGWFQGRSEFGPRALGHRSLFANPKFAQNLERLNNIKGREQFRPVAPMVLADRAPEIFEGQLPSPYMLFTHRVKPQWREAIAAAVHVDGTARVQTVDEREEPLVARMLREFERLTGIPVVINTSFNTAGRPMVDEPRDALECFGSTPLDALAIGPYLLRRAGVLAHAV
ncbi:MAG: carbamoyltransferase [Candidatus Baltobacteraceae bacterium]